MVMAAVVVLQAAVVPLAVLVETEQLVALVETEQLVALVVLEQLVALVVLEQLAVLVVLVMVVVQRLQQTLIRMFSFILITQHQ
jgi:hypothetical protein